MARKQPNKKATPRAARSTGRGRSRAPAEPTRVVGREVLEQLMFGTGRVRRFTQDSPVLPDVWLDYAGVAGDWDEWDDGTGENEVRERKKLLITPYKDRGAGDVRKEIVKRLPEDEIEPARVAYNQTTVAARLRFRELIRIVLPMTDWWARIDSELPMKKLATEPYLAALTEAVADPEHAPPLELKKKISGKRAERTASSSDQKPADDVELVRFQPALLWTMRVVGTLAIIQDGRPLPAGFRGGKGVAAANRGAWKQVVAAFLGLIEGVETGRDTSRIYSVSRNRMATPALVRSALAIKADAARRLFNISCADITWAIIDSGVDATHPAFRMRKGVDGTPSPDIYDSRVVRTYDFTQIDLLLDPRTQDRAPVLRKRLAEEPGQDLQTQIADLRAALESGRQLDWKLLEPLLRVPHEPGKYVEPKVDHGTHVAGILGADWRARESRGALREDLSGVCNDIRLYDLRVFDERGRGEEFGVMAALQFVRYLNASNDYMVVHGANLSLSIRHEIANYACGRTPVCDECERVVSSGIVVVAAAGNQGHRRFTTEQGGTAEAYNSISITDPGNAELVITVGATHRYRPHTYGVSYFSSRGPTGDGRKKPDLVAPGEKITAPLPQEGIGQKDGTSMAAPHVSGAAAMLMARHNELVGEPQRIKKILCGTTTDLGRERYFQGAGMLDVLRALQSV